MEILTTHHQAVLQRITHIKYDYLYDGPPVDGIQVTRDPYDTDVVSIVIV